MNSHAFRTIVIGMMAALSLLVSACDDLSTGLVKRGYSFFIHNPLRWFHPQNALTDHINPVDSIDPDTNATNPRVAFNRKGNAVMVWTQMEPIGRVNIYKSEYRNGRWSHPDKLDEDFLNDPGNYNNVSQPTVAVAEDDSYVIAWIQQGNSNPMNNAFVYACNNVSCGLIKNYDSPGVIEITTRETQSVEVAIQNSSKAYVAVSYWNSSNVYEIRVFEIDIAAMENKGYNVVTENITASDAALPKIAMDEKGNSIIVWQQSNGSRQQIYMSVFRGVSWTKPILSDNINYDSVIFAGAFMPQVVMNNYGQALIAWTQNTASPQYSHIYYSMYNIQNDSLDRPIGAADNRIDTADLNENGGTDPQLAIDGSGNAVAVWTNNKRIQMSQYGSNSGTWSEPQYIDPDPGSYSSSNPDVAMNDGGDVVVAWVEYDGSFMRVYKSEYRGERWIHPTDLADNNIDAELTSNNNAFEPHVSMANSGQTIIVWHQVYQKIMPDNYHYIYMSQYRPALEILPFLY